MDSECDDDVARALCGGLSEEEARINWDLPVKFAADCVPCEACGEPWCPECGCHYADCQHPGPHADVETPSCDRG